MSEIIAKSKEHKVGIAHARPNKRLKPNSSTSDSSRRRSILIFEMSSTRGSTISVPFYTTLKVQVHPDYLYASQKKQMPITIKSFGRLRLKVARSPRIGQRQRKSLQ